MVATPVGRTVGPAGIGALARRFALAFAGEGTQSAFHLVVNLVLMRSLPAYDYGLFAIIFTLGSLALTYSHALVSTPAAVYIPRLRSPGAADFQDVVFGTVATGFAVVAGAAGALLLLVWSRSVPLALAAGAFVGLWSLRNWCRTALFARRRPAVAMRSDLAFAASGLVVAALAFSREPSGMGRLAEAFLLLAGANAVGIAVALRSYPRRVRVSLRAGVRRRYARIWPGVSWSLLGITTVNVQAQFQTFLVALLASPAAYAPIAASLVLLAPLRLAVNSLIFLAQPEFSDALAGGRRERARNLLLAAFGLVLLACMAYGAALWLGWGLVRAHVFGPSFADAPMGLVTALAWAITLLYLAYSLPKALIEAAGQFRDVARATLLSAAVGVAAVSVLLALGGPVWSLLGVIVAEAVTLALLWPPALGLVRTPSRPGS